MNGKITEKKRMKEGIKKGMKEGIKEEMKEGIKEEILCFQAALLIECSLILGHPLQQSLLPCVLRRMGPE